MKALLDGRYAQEGAEAVRVWQAVRSVPNMAARNADKKFPKMSALNTGYAMHVGKMSEQVRINPKLPPRYTLNPDP